MEELERFIEEWSGNLLRVVFVVGALAALLSADSIAAAFRTYY